MPDSEHSIPDELPEEFSSYEQRVKQLDVGETGKTGVIRISLDGDPETKKTVIKELFSKVPLQVQKTLYVEESFPQMAYVYIMSPSGGILQGDRLRIDVSLENGAQAHVTTQAATKIYRMNRNYAAQLVNVFVGDGCYLELIPDQLIPYRNARFYQYVKLQVHENATVLYSEIITPGRVSSGEYFKYDVCYFKTVATDQYSELRFMDALMLEPKKQKLFYEFGLKEKFVLGNMYILTKALNARSLSDTVHNMFGGDSVTGSSSVLPGDDGVLVRMIAGSVSEVKEVIDLILNKIRNDVLRMPFSGTRKY